MCTSVNTLVYVVCVHEAHAHTASTPARPWCVGNGDASRARVFPLQRHAYSSVVCGVDRRACM